MAMNTRYVEDGEFPRPKVSIVLANSLCPSYSSGQWRCTVWTFQDHDGQVLLTACLQNDWRKAEALVKSGSFLGARSEVSASLLLFPYTWHLQGHYKQMSASFISTGTTLIPIIISCSYDCFILVDKASSKYYLKWWGCKNWSSPCKLRNHGCQDHIKRSR